MRLARTIIFTLLILAVLVALIIKSNRERARTMRPRIGPILTIKWQRLVNSDGRTCARCSATEKEAQVAARKLRQSLAPLGIRVQIEAKPIDAKTFAKDPLASNQIRIAGRPLEEWIGANVGKSACSTCPPSACNDTECRTLSVGGQTYETIPAELIIKAGLLAASDMIAQPKTAPCCGTTP